MTTIKLTLNLAFHDVDQVTLDNIRSSIIERALNGFCAEVAFTSDSREREVDIADPDWDAEDCDTQINTWHERAHTELDSL